MDVQNDNDDGKVSSFWKKSSKPVPGRPSPRKESKNQYNPSTSTSFQDFQQSIDDVWDLGDDEFCSISNIKLSKKGSHTGGNNLITIHKSKSPISLNSNLTNSNQRLIRDRANISKEGTDKQLIKQKRYKIDIGKQDTPETDAFRNKVKKFETLLNAAFLDLTELQNLSYPGIPFPVKGETWRILAGYAPPCLEIRKETLQKKRAEYWYYVRSYYETETRDDAYQGTYRQIHIDIPRMSPTIPLFRQKTVQDMFERILFVWAVRHPASGYVQGINDLVTPFFIVFLHQILDQDIDLDTVDLESVDQVKRNLVEADSYWCFCKFLAGIQDNYIFPQLGIQDKISRLRELINRIDVTLHKHLQNNGIEYLQFSFRWMNNLLTRELPLRCLIRLWDTYLAELETFASFQLFVCAAFLLHWKQELMNEKDFQGLMLMLQNLPTQNWDASDINVLVAEAYKLKYTFGGAPNHFQTSGS